MSKGRRNHKGTKEYSDNQRLKHEIEKLKRDNAQLRKQLSKTNWERNHDIQELVFKAETEQLMQQSKSKSVEDSKKEWQCHKCDEGFLRIIMIPRLDGMFYFRKCSSKGCDQRTRLKKYTSDVKGIKANEEES